MIPDSNWARFRGLGYLPESQTAPTIDSAWVSWAWRWYEQRSQWRRLCRAARGGWL